MSMMNWGKLSFMVARNYFFTKDNLFQLNIEQLLVMYVAILPREGEYVSWFMHISQVQDQVNPKTPKWFFHFGSWNCESQDQSANNKWCWNRSFENLEKVLKWKYRKWVFMLHLEIWSLSYEERNGWELNWQFDFQLLKCKKQESNNLIEHVIWHCKCLCKDYNFSIKNFDWETCILEL